MRLAVFGGLGSWQLLMIWAALTADVDGSRLVLVAAHGALMILALLGTRRAVTAETLLLAVYAVTVLDWRAAVELDGAQTLATIANASLTVGTPLLVLSRRRAALFAALALTVDAVSLATFHPDWALAALSTIGPGAAGALLIGTALVRVLGAIASRSDAADAAIEAEWKEVLVTRTIARRAADDARVLHDTIINTLGAVASGGSSVHDGELLRQRCERDLAAVEALLEGRHTEAQTLVTALEHARLLVEVHRSGETDHALAAAEAGLPEATVRAAASVLLELVRNAAKHSGVSRVGIEVQLTDGLPLLIVTDDGDGLDPQSASARRLLESLDRRVDGSGVEVTVDTAPGRGLRATVDVVPVEQASQPDPPPVGPPIATMRRSMCWALAVVIVASGLLTELGQRPGRITPAAASVLLVGLLSLVSWCATRGGRPLPMLAQPLVVAGLPSGFLLTLVGVDLGAGEVHRLQVTGLTPLLVILLVTVPGRRCLLVAVTALGLTAVAVTLHLWGSDQDAAAVIPIAATAQLSLFAGCYLFLGLLSDAAERADAQRGRELSLEIELAARRGLDGTAIRSTVRSLRASAELLRDLAARTADAADPLVRGRCSTEEHHLRQLIMLDPDLVLLTPWLVRSLDRARARGVRLTIRSGTVDAPDPAAAAALGRILLDGVDAAASGTEVSVGLFVLGGKLRLLMSLPATALVRLGGGRPDLGPQAVRDGLPAAVQISTSRLAAQGLVEVVVDPSRQALAHTTA